MITEMMPTMSAEDMKAALLSATQKLQEQENTNDQKTVSTQEAEQQALLAEQSTQAQQAIDDQAKAQQATQGDSAWDKVKLAFQWIGSIISIAVGAILCATGVGAAFGALMVAGGLAGIVGATNATLASATGLGIAGNIAKDSGASAAACQKADEGFGIALTVFTCVLAVAGLAGSVGSMFVAADSAADTAEEVTSAAEEVSESAQMTAKAANITGNAINGAGQVVTGAGTIVVANDQRKAGKLNADAMDVKADAGLTSAKAEQVAALIKLFIQENSAFLKSIAAAESQISSMVGSAAQAVNGAAQLLG
jgi:hypothetical protein